MIRCAVFRNLLTAAVLAGEDPGWPLRSHTGHCIGCQAYEASLRATRRRLAGLKSEPVGMPVGFEIAVLNRLEDEFRPGFPRGRWVRAAGASMAAALVAAVWMRRRATARV